ncbi:MAG: biotin--[acetyl-CoA-carboxylase] ligase [Candidatus Sulfomarinibacteraceae bacterium]
MPLGRGFSEAAERLATAAKSLVENVVILTRIDSTQSFGLRLVDQAEAEEIVLPSTLVIAGEQTQGRGRSVRTWTSPPGGLYLSFIASSLAPDAIARLPMIAATAVSEAIVALGIDGVAIKWPNDIFIDGEKCAGCLVHARHGATRWVVVGIGVNLEGAPDLEDGGSVRATSLADRLSGGLTDDGTDRLLRVILEELTAGIADPGASLIRWKERLLHRPGDEMTVRLGDGTEIGGRFIGLTDNGHLRLDVAGDERTVAAGDVVE